MSEWKTVAQLSDLPEKGSHSAELDGINVALFRDGDVVYALENYCPHLGFPLSDGWMEGTTVTCPWHGWRFNVEDGQCILGGGDAQAYEVRVEDGAVQVKLED